MKVGGHLLAPCVLPPSPPKKKDFGNGAHRIGSWIVSGADPELVEKRNVFVAAA
jgi:hypothetical protein